MSEIIENADTTPEENVIEIPNKWKAGVITNDGLGLLSKLVKGHTLPITRAVIGAGWTDPENLIALKAVMEPMQEMTFSAVSYPEEGKSVIPCKLTNAEVTESYIGRQIGLYATDPDKGEILYYIAQVENEDGGTGIPANNIIPSYSATWNLVIYYGMADGVDVTVDPAGAVTQEEMEQFVVDYVGEALDAYTIQEIEAAIGTVDPGIGGGSSGGGGGGTLDHSMLYNRDADDQHPIGAVEGLEEELARLQDMAEDDAQPIKDMDIDTLWDEVMSEPTA